MLDNHINNGYILIRDNNGVFEPKHIEIRTKSNPASTSNNKKFKTALNSVTQKQSNMNSIKSFVE